MSGYLQKPGGGGGVTDINGLTGAVTLSEGNNITLNESGNDIEITANFTQEGKYMISGGITWSGTGLTYDVSFLTYFFNGNKTADPTQVTLAASDPTNNRFDAIVVDEAGTVTTITGTPSANPEVPAIPEDQLQVTIILVAAGSTTPTIASEEIYMDDPTTNWTFSTYQTATPTGSINFAGTTSPKQGIECIQASTDLRLGARFVRGTAFDAYQYTMLQVWVRFTGTAVASNKSLNVRFENSAGTLVANTINLFNYGLQRGVLNTWQLVVVPITAFGALPATVKGLKMIMAGGTVGVVRQWDIDFMILTNGSVPYANVPTIAFYKDDIGIASQSGLNLKQGTGVTITAVNDPTNQRVNYTIDAGGGSSITEGAPTQANRASVDIQVLDNDYESINGLQITFGTSPNEQVLEFYDSDTDPVPTAPIIGIDIGGGTYRKAADTLVGPGSSSAEIVEYDTLAGTFNIGEDVKISVDVNADVYAQYGDYLYLYNQTGAGSIQTGDIIVGITSGEEQDVTSSGSVYSYTIPYTNLSGTFINGEIVYSISLEMDAIGYVGPTLYGYNWNSVELGGDNQHICNIDENDGSAANNGNQYGLAIVTYSSKVGTYNPGDAWYTASASGNVIYDSGTELYLSVNSGTISPSDVVTDDDTSATATVVSLTTETGYRVDTTSTVAVILGESIVGGDDTASIRIVNDTGSELRTILLIDDFSGTTSFFGITSNASADAVSPVPSSIPVIQIFDTSGPTGTFTIDEAIIDYGSFGTIIGDDGVEFLYLNPISGQPIEVGGSIVGLTSAATAEVVSSTTGIFNFINDGDNITIGGKTYTWQETLTNVDGNVQLGTDDGDSLSNLSLALQLTGTPGTDYAASMTANAFVSSGGSSSTSLDVIALIPGTTGNSIAVSQSIASGEYDWNSPTLVSGSDPTTDDIANLIDSAINQHSVSGIPSQNILADVKIMSSTLNSNIVNVYVMRPGTYGNGIAVDSTDDSAITTFTSTTVGGADDGTTGTIGSFRKGPVIIGVNNASQYTDCIFEAIDNNVWVIISSSTSVNNGYDWTNI